MVRVMKSRKSLTHSLLMASVMEQLGQHFHCDPRIIKKRIERYIQYRSTILKLKTALSPVPGSVRFCR